MIIAVNCPTAIKIIIVDEMPVESTNSDLKEFVYKQNKMPLIILMIIPTLRLSGSLLSLITGLQGKNLPTKPMKSI